ncbi:MAG: cytochrome-c peroxidase, partial [Planctomycetota bacterium]
YMHDGSLATLKDVVEHYRKGGTPNPHLSPKMFELELTDADVDALVAFMEALAGEGYMDTAPALFPE